MQAGRLLLLLQTGRKPGRHARTQASLVMSMLALSHVMLLLILLPQ